MLLTAGERVLLHLLRYWNAKDTPPAISQQGIAEGARIRRSHVPRTVKALARERYVEEREGRVRARGRKVKVYFLTEAGLRRARELADALGAQVVLGDAGPTTVSELAASTGRTLVEIAQSLDEDGRYRPVAKEAPREEPDDGFLDREEELRSLAMWLRGPGSAAVVYGGGGMGKTALARRFLQGVSRPFWWRELAPDATAAELVDDLARFLAEHGRGRTEGSRKRGGDPWDDLAADLDGFDGVLVLDGYGAVAEEVVDLADRLLRTLRSLPRTKLLVLAEEATPSYCRFYDRGAVEAGAVTEVHLRGLGPEESRKLLGRPDIADEAFRRIYLLTKGCPLYLELIRSGDAGALKARSRFTTAEVNLLLFSRDVRA